MKGAAIMQTIDLYDVPGNVFDRIGRQWMLITARKGGRVNAMTASWGGLGEMWNRRAAFVFVRPQRYTYEFMETADTFSLCFLKDSHKGAHKIMGSQSGRDLDKNAAAGLTVLDHGGYPYFAESELVLCCEKLYRGDLREDDFVDKGLVAQHYPGKDFHRMYIGGVCLALRP